MDGTARLVLIDEQLRWVFPGGFTIPLIGGSDGAGGGAAGGGDGGGGDGGAGGGDGGKGGGGDDGKGGAGGGDKGGDKGGGSGGDDGKGKDDKKGKGGDDDDEGLTPAELRDALARVRKENAQRRASGTATKAELDKANASIEAIQKALGLTPDSQDPAKLTADITKLQGDLRQARIENAFNRVAATMGADVSLTWAYLFASGEIATIEGEGDELAKAIREKVKGALDANPKLKADATPARSGGDHKGGGNGNGTADMNAAIRRAAGRSS